MSPDEFKAKWGLAWYKLINSEMGRDALSTLRSSGPLNRVLGVSAKEVAEFGSIYTAQNQGWFDCVGTMETLMIIQKEGAQLGEPTYSETEEGEQSDPKKKVKKRRR